MSPAKNYFPALTGIRALAAYLVFVFHFNPFRGFAHEPHTLGHKLFSLCDTLHIGVTIFFVLSGFLISLRYQDNVRLSKDWLFHYALNRFARLFPMYALALGFTCAVLGLRIDYDYVKQFIYFPPIPKVSAILLSLTLLKGFSSSLKFSGIAQAWSLTVEECFYFTAPFVLISRLAFGLKMALYVATSLAVGLLLTGIGAYAKYYGFFSSLDFLFSYTFFGRCLEFTLGMALAYLVRGQQSFSFRHFTYGGIAGIMLCLIGLTYYPKTVWAGVVINNCLLPVAICSLLLGLIREPGYLRRVLETRLAGLLGRASYTFYLLHMGVVQLLIGRFISPHKLVLFLLLNALAVVLFKLVEEPCHRALQQLAGVARLATAPAERARPGGPE
ncbi:MAG: acyltransferase family protein [Janthinobacterium lividum]